MDDATYHAFMHGSGVEAVSTDELAEAVSADERAYHLSVLEQVKFTATLQQHWMKHLSEKYALSDGDQVLANGAIVRASRP